MWGERVEEKREKEEKEENEEKRETKEEEGRRAGEKEEESGKEANKRGTEREELAIILASIQIYIFLAQLKPNPPSFDERMDNNNFSFMTLLVE